MAEVKISALGSATSLIGTEAVPVVQGGVTKRATTQDIANLLQPAIDVVSQALSVEQNARNADIKRLSDQISDIISAGGGAISVTSAKLDTASATANLHINAVSLNLADFKSAVSAPSVKTSTGGSVHGLQSVFNALSDRIAGVAAGVNSVTSAEVSLLQNTSVKNSAGNSVKGRQSVFDALSARIRDGEIHASAASDAATSANVHANNASAAATSILNYICAVSCKSGATSVRGLQSIVQQLSAHINALSITPAGVSVTSNELSAAVKVSAKSASTSVRGLQSVVDQLSTRIAGVVAGVASVTSTKLSAQLQYVTGQISILNAIVATNSADRVSADNVLSFRISVVSNALSMETARALSVEKAFSDLLSAAALNTNSVLNVLSGAILSINAQVSNLSASYTSLVNRVSANSGTGGGGSVTSAKLSTYVSAATSALNLASARTTAALSTHGLQNVINALSSKAGGGGGTGSVTSTKVSQVALSVMNVASANLAALSAVVKNLSDVVSARIVSLANFSLQISAVDTHANTASAAATSADAHANAASGAATSVDVRATSLELRLSTLSANHTSLAALVCNALSAGDVTSAKIADLSNRHSILSQKASVLSAGIGIPELHVLTNTATISASGLTKISGLSCTLVSTKAYQIRAVLHHSHSAPNAFGLGVSAPTPTTLTGVWRGFTSVVAAGTASALVGYFNQVGLGSITYSATPAASATTYRTELNVDLANATSGRLQLKARSSATGVGAIDIRAGSYIQAFRLN